MNENETENEPELEYVPTGEAELSVHCVETDGTAYVRIVIGDKFWQTDAFSANKLGRTVMKAAREADKFNQKKPKLVGPTGQKLSQ